MVEGGAWAGGTVVGGAFAGGAFAGGAFAGGTLAGCLGIAKNQSRLFLIVEKDKAIAENS